jgi:hypothetical protein
MTCKAFYQYACFLLEKYIVKKQLFMNIWIVCYVPVSLGGHECQCSGGAKL